MANPAPRTRSTPPEREDPVRQRHQSLRETHHLGPPIAIRHALPDSGDDDIADEQDSAQHMQRFQQGVGVHDARGPRSQCNDH